MENWKTEDLKINSFEDERELTNDVNQTKEVFDYKSFLSKTVSLVQQNQINLIFEIEEQISPFDITEQFCVLNSQLPKYVFNEIENYSDEKPQEFYFSCLNICYRFVSIRKYKPKISQIIERFEELISRKFVFSLNSMLKMAKYAQKSLLIISNIFYRNETIFSFFNENGINIIEILLYFSQTGDDKMKSISSLILKRILKCDFDTNAFNSYLVNNIENLIHISNFLFESNSFFAQIKTFQMISKLIRHHSKDIDFRSNDIFNKFIIDSINKFTNSTEIIIFGNVLHLIFSIIEANQSQNQEYLNFIFSQIIICDIIKKGFSSGVSFIQSASSSIFSYIISSSVPLTQKILESNIIDLSFQILDDSDFKGKETILKSIFNLFWINDLDLTPLFNKLDFFCEHLAFWPNEIILIFNRLIVKYPSLVGPLMECNIVEKLDDIIFNEGENQNNFHLAAQALKSDILNLAERNQFA